MSKILDCGIWSEDDEAGTKQDACSYGSRAQSTALDGNQSSGRDEGMGGDSYARSCSCGRAKTAEGQFVPGGLGHGARTHNQDMSTMVDQNEYKTDEARCYRLFRSDYSADASDFKIQTVLVHCSVPVHIIPSVHV